MDIEKEKFLNIQVVKFTEMPTRQDDVYGHETWGFTASQDESGLRHFEDHWLSYESFKQEFPTAEHLVEYVLSLDDFNLLNVNELTIQIIHYQVTENCCDYVHGIGAVPGVLE